MDFEQLRNLSEQYEVRIDNHSDFERTPPFYYDSLKHAFTAYFNTFHTQNASYDYYARGLNNRNIEILKRQLLDEDNTVLAIIGFERYFELFLKDLLKQVDSNLIYQVKDNNKNISTLINRIECNKFKLKEIGGKPLTIPFRETINRFFGLAELVKNEGKSNLIIPKFTLMLKQYSFLVSTNNKASLKLLNWYRDRILHNGNRLPSLWLLDYIVTQRFAPIIKDIINTDHKRLGKSMYYLTTVTEIDILKELCSVHFEFSDLQNKPKDNQIFQLLLRIGHLKELGRANLNMNLFVRKNYQAGYEYNYKDPIGRGKRFAQIEKKKHEHAKDIKNCPCCGENSLVLYNEKIDDIFNQGQKKNIQWIKCYTCDYHLRDNADDPFFFNLYPETIFKP
ncbi:hypothetical protein KFE94_01945 [bacterium SCSIO 12643]|nr:hypothetical protein KFE94_01945 [bacterium SCSIO 12643]